MIYFLKTQYRMGNITIEQLESLVELSRITKEELAIITA